MFSVTTAFELDGLILQLNIGIHYCVLSHASRSIVLGVEARYIPYTGEHIRIGSILLRRKSKTVVDFSYY